MDMCRRMMEGMSEAKVSAAYATPEIRGLFEEWVVQMEDEILSYVEGKDPIDPADVAKHFSLTEQSATSLLGRLAEKGKVKFRA